MNYNKVVKAKFIERPNRFIAYCEINGNIEKVHVKNTGRCRELLTPKCSVYLEESDNPNRKTRYSLIAVEKEDRLINMDSQVPNKVIYEALKNGKITLPGIDEKVTLIKPEKTYGNSRFDIYLEAGDKKAFIEIKGVTLEEENIVKFPDAKTERGVKHIRELIEARKEGYYCYIIFLVQMDNVLYFTPNNKMHKELGDALIEAKNNGVEVLAYDSLVTKNSIDINKDIEVKL
ncbi:MULTISPECIES: DNA/RNA nuclease SfsA [unclassified Romboutsia]|uniref:DNA/RNA nuclease SfsA n=1 Tax=unclassified Romboutsia TaxID=2626894 RepID=UPI0008223739|nr:MULTISPECIES: DNA/RNA nuclease SfsA [unclassified Romboutsia]SCH92782.1 Sugar fermentation stimulation protein A [uncultured Clostridium sp.]